MGLNGTTEKCKACGKAVYVVDMVTTDGVPYHKSCFKCSHCNGTLVMGRHSTMEGVLYCTPHFEQLFKEMGSDPKAQASANSEKPNILKKAPSKLSSMFSGTQDKCAICKKTAYPVEKLVVEGQNYHKSCFRCAKGGCILSASNYAALDGILYCKPHFGQLFKEKGSYSYLTKSMSTKNSKPQIAEEEVASEEKAAVEQVQDQ